METPKVALKKLYNFGGKGGFKNNSQAHVKRVSKKPAENAEGDETADESAGASATLKKHKFGKVQGKFGGAKGVKTFNKAKNTGNLRKHNELTEE